jgi:hypothetical protein
MPYLLRRLRPAIERELGEGTVTQLFVTEPRACLPYRLVT